jgi:hypothetical protein
MTCADDPLRSSFTVALMSRSPLVTISSHAATMSELRITPHNSAGVPSSSSDVAICRPVMATNVLGMSVGDDDGLVMLESEDGSESGNAGMGASESGNAETGASESGNAETGASESGNAEMGASELGNAETGASESGNAETGASESGNAETGASESGNAAISGAMGAPASVVIGIAAYSVSSKLFASPHRNTMRSIATIAHQNMLPIGFIL